MKRLDMVKVMLTVIALTQVFWVAKAVVPAVWDKVDDLGWYISGYLDKVAQANRERAQEAEYREDRKRYGFLYDQMAAWKASDQRIRDENEAALAKLKK